jgi:hypothetical protein
VKGCFGKPLVPEDTQVDYAVDDHTSSVKTHEATS